MAINPQIVVPQIQGVQLENPMTFARNALAIKQAQSEIAANELAAQQAGKFNALLAASQKPNGQPLTPEILMAAGLFKPAKELSEAQAAKTTGQKESVDLVGKAMETSARLLDTIRTPNEMIAWHEANHADPVLGPYLASRGITADQSRAKIMQVSQDPEAFNQLLLDARLGLKESRVQHFVEQNYGGGTRVLEMPKYGGPSKVVPGSDIKVTPSPNRQGVTILTPAESEFSRTIGKQAGERLQAREQSAQSAAKLISSSERLSPLLNSKDFISGTFADARLSVARALGIDVSETESYFSGIGEQVAERIKAFGAGTGLSDKDREFAERIAGGERVTTVEGIRRIMRINNQSAAAVIKSYNDELDFLSKDRPEVRTLYRPVQLEKKALRYGTLNNRRVAEYSDGTVAYVD